MCVLLFGLGGLLINPIVDVGDRLVKGCFGGFVVFGIYRLAISAPNGQACALAVRRTDLQFVNYSKSHTYKTKDCCCTNV